MELSVGRAFRGTPHRTRRYGHFRAQLDAVLNKFFHAFRVHHEENDVGFLTADLKSHARAAHGEHGGGIPMTVPALAAHHHTASISATKSKGELDRKSTRLNS